MKGGGASCAASSRRLTSFQGKPELHARSLSSHRPCASRGQASVLASGRTEPAALRARFRVQGRGAQEADGRRSLGVGLAITSAFKCLIAANH